ncbi:MAG TPA: glutamyl-tRNA reductase [Gemmatimonadales bacterium]
MPLVLVGISHRTAPVAIREILALSPTAQRELLQRLGGDVQAGAGADEFAVLSTCNRTELYAADSTDSGRSAALSEALAGVLTGMASPPAALEGRIYRENGLEVVRHLCRVAAGLDSMVPGESEVMGQVAMAHELARAAGHMHSVLDAAFRAARRAGRRARTETGIARGATGVGSEAARLLADLSGPLDDREILVVGTGKIGRLAGEALRARGARRLSVVSRTAEHATHLARTLGARALAWHDLPQALAAADVVVCATGAPHAVITRELLVRAMGATGDGRTRIIVDLAVPRDVEAGVGALPGVTLIDLDGLEQRLAAAFAERRGAFPAVDRIVEDEVAQFDAWRRGERLRPLIADLRDKSDRIRVRELDRMLRRLGGVSPELRAELEAFSQSLVTKLLHAPTRRLREAVNPDRAQSYQSALRDLFDLSEHAPGLDA